MTSKDVVIIGGGAAGLTAAISAARSGSAVAVLEHMDRVGKKILSTGNGKCNLSNELQGGQNYRGPDPDFVYPVLEAFDLKKTLSFFRSIGILTISKKGYLYPRTEQASSVLDALRFECERQGAELKTLCRLQEIRPLYPGFLIRYEEEGKKRELRTGSLIIASGGLSAAKTGSDGSIDPFLLKLGHSLTKRVPALCPLKCKGDFWGQISGVRTDAEIRLFSEEKALACERGNLQLTGYGISGIPVFQLSRWAAYELKKEHRVTAEVDFLPELESRQLQRYLQHRARATEGEELLRTFEGLLPKKLLPLILKKSGLEPKRKGKRLSEKEIKAFLLFAKAFPIEIKEPLSFEQSQVTAGGISVKEVNPFSLESRLLEGLFFAGEILDVDGRCGGYNLQWAWSSGYLAGKHASEYGKGICLE